MAVKDIVDRLLVLRARNQPVIELTEEYPARIEFQADRFFLVDPEDKTRRLGFDVSGAAPGATIINGGAQVVSTGGEYAEPIVLTATDSGKTYLLDDAAGLAFLLPEIDATNVGMRFTFLVATAVSSNAYTITAAAGDLLLGHVTITDKDAAYDSDTADYSIIMPDGSDDLVITIDDSDTGTIAGGWLELTAYSESGWFVRGSLIGDGTIVTIFS